MQVKEKNNLLDVVLKVENLSLRHSERILSSVLTKTIVIIPAFNEEANIGIIVRGIKIDLPNIEVVVINDGSTDMTEYEAKKAGAIVLSHVNQMGYGITLQTGYKYAVKQGNYEYIIQIDGDGQHKFEDILKLLQPLVAGEADFVLGSRFIDETGYNMPFVRKLGVLFFRMLIYFITKKKIRDVTSGMQAFNRKILAHYVSDQFPCYYPDANMLILLIKNGFTLIEMSTVMVENKQGKSMHNGLGNQIYYVITMILSIVVVICKELGKKYVK